MPDSLYFCEGLVHHTSQDKEHSRYVVVSEVEYFCLLVKNLHSLAHIPLDVVLRGELACTGEWESSYRIIKPIFAATNRHGTMNDRVNCPAVRSVVHS